MANKYIQELQTKIDLYEKKLSDYNQNVDKNQEHTNSNQEKDTESSAILIEIEKEKAILTKRLQDQNHVCTILMFHLHTVDKSDFDSLRVRCCSDVSFSA